MEERGKKFAMQNCIEPAKSGLFVTAARARPNADQSKQNTSFYSNTNQVDEIY